jgi:hypothetical protein
MRGPSPKHCQSILSSPKIVKTVTLFTYKVKGDWSTISDELSRNTITSTDNVRTKRSNCIGKLIAKNKKYRTMIDTMVWFCNNKNFEIIGLYDFERPGVNDRTVPAGG